MATSSAAVMFSREARKVFWGGCFRAKREVVLGGGAFARSVNCFRRTLSREARKRFEEGRFRAKHESLLSEGAFSRSAPEEDAAWHAEVTMAPNMKRADEQAHG